MINQYCNGINKGVLKCYGICLVDVCVYLAVHVHFFASKPKTMYEEEDEDNVFIWHNHSWGSNKLKKVSS